MCLLCSMKPWRHVTFLMRKSSYCQTCHAIGGKKTLTSQTKKIFAGTQREPISTPHQLHKSISPLKQQSIKIESAFLPLILSHHPLNWRTKQFLKQVTKKMICLDDTLPGTHCIWQTALHGEVGNFPIISPRSSHQMCWMSLSGYYKETMDDKLSHLQGHKNSEHVAIDQMISMLVKFIVQLKGKLTKRRYWTVTIILTTSPCCSIYFTWKKVRLRWSLTLY